MASADWEDLSKLHLNSDIDSNALVQLLEQQLQDLDATEFELPQVSELPTLESILNEPDDGEDFEDSASESDGHHSPPESEPKASFSSEAETVSVHSRTSSRGSSELLSGGTGSATAAKPRRSNGFQSAAASVVRHVALTGIASQLVSAHERVGAGLPTTMAVGSVICVGTSHGLIMVFEPSQTLKWCLEATQSGEQHGSVSALALSEDGNRLLAGYAKGHLCLFDLITGSLMQSIADAHTACTAVLHLKWTDFPNIAMMSDSGGSVFELAVKRTMGLNSNMSRCIFTGSRGEVCTVEPLLMSRFHVAPLLHNVIVAMATITKVIVVSLRPSPKVLFSHPLRAASSSLPLLAWQFVVIQMPDKTRVVDPVLAFGRQNSLYFYQVTHGLGDSLQFLPLRKITTDYLLHNMAWLNPSTIALLDSLEQCHVMDVRSQNVIETLDLTNLGLVYASQHFKATATGGNVSKAMAVAGERACYHSMVSFGNQVILLGTKALQVLTVRSWHERLDQLYGAGQVAACLQLARQMAAGRATAVVGLPHRRSRRRAALQEKITALVEEIMEAWWTLEVGPPAVSELVQACMECGLQSLLLGRVWDVLQDSPDHKGVFLECLEAPILSSVLPSLPPNITQQLLTHYERLGRLDALEACIVHLSVTSLDVHQTMTMCWHHGLYDAILYVSTLAMRDYVTPLEELVTVLSNALDSLKEGEALPPAMVSLGNRVLVYVSCCLAGRGYPTGDIEPDMLQQVKYEVFKFLSSVHSKNADESQKPFPYLRTFLRFDTREFLNVFSLAFEEAEFNTELGALQRQRLIDVLMQVMSESESSFTPREVCSLHIFVSRQLGKMGDAGAPARDTLLVDKVVAELCNPELTSMTEERESALLQLLQDGVLQHLQHEDLLRMATDAKFWRVCESLYVSMSQPEQVLGCYLKDPGRQQQVLPYLQRAAAEQTTEQLQWQLTQHFQSLVTLDAVGVGALLLHTLRLAPLVPSLVASLEGQVVPQYAALKGLFFHHGSGKRSGGSNSQLSPQLQLQLLKLMCHQDPGAVLYFLQHATCPVEDMLRVVRDYGGLRECEAALLLLAGDVGGALEIHLQLLTEATTELKEFKCEEECEDDVTARLRDFETKVQHVISLLSSYCRGGSEEGERRPLWLQLLQLLLRSPHAQHPAVAAVVGECCGAVVSAMLCHVSPPAVLECVLREPTAAHTQHVLRLLHGLVSRYRYDRRVYAAMSGAVRSEQLECVRARRRAHRAPLVVTRPCVLCGGGEGRLRVYRCGHSYHESCASKLDEESLAAASSRSKASSGGCFVCTNSPSQLSFMTASAALRQRDKAAAGACVRGDEAEATEVTEGGNSEASDDCAQEGIASRGDKSPPEQQVELSNNQREAVRRVQRLGLTGCRVAILEQLSQRSDVSASDAYGDDTIQPNAAGRHDKWLAEKFPLRLAPSSTSKEYEDL